LGPDVTDPSLTALASPDASVALYGAIAAFCVLENSLFRARDTKRTARDGRTRL